MKDPWDRGPARGQGRGLSPRPRAQRPHALGRAWEGQAPAILRRAACRSPSTARREDREGAGHGQGEEVWGRGLRVCPWGRGRERDTEPVGSGVTKRRRTRPSASWAPAGADGHLPPGTRCGSRDVRHLLGCCPRSPALARRPPAPAPSPSETRAPRPLRGRPARGWGATPLIVK